MIGKQHLVWLQPLGASKDGHEGVERTGMLTKQQKRFPLLSLRRTDAFEVARARAWAKNQACNLLATCSLKPEPTLSKSLGSTNTQSIEPHDHLH